MGQAKISSGGEESDDALDGGVGAVIGGFEAAIGAVLGVWRVVEAAVGEGSAEGAYGRTGRGAHLDAFWRQTIGIA